MKPVHNNTYKSIYFIVPSYILNLPELTLGYLRVFETIFQFWNHEKPCFLSLRSLSERTGLCKSEVCYALNYFELHGHLIRRIKDGKRYFVQPEKGIPEGDDDSICSSQDPESTEENRVSTTVDRGVHHSGQGVSSGVDTNKKNINKENNLKDLPDSSKSGTTRILKDYEKDERFMRFYSIYPKKEDPRDARKAFKAVVGNDDELLEQIIMDIAQRKLNHSRWQDRQYIKNPAVYLRKGEFLGEIFNNEKEMQVKKEALEIQTKEKMAEQERLSKKRADELLQYEQSKQTDSFAYKNIITQLQERPKGLENLKKSMGMN